MTKLKNWQSWRLFWKEKKEASYTVEAALVMAITLFLMASLLTEAFKTHGQIVGDMVLQDTMEQWGYLEEEKEEKEIFQKEIVQKAGHRLRSYFWCGDMRLNITESGLRINGTVNDGHSSSISIRAFEPEKFLRLLRAVGL